MAVKIQVKRGAEANVPVLSQGELAFTTDTNKVFIGDGSTNHEVITSNSTSLDSRYFTETELQDHSSNADSGAKKIGVYDEFTNSSSNNVQDVLKDLDADLATIDDEWVQDVVGAMVSGNNESGIEVTYDDVNGKLNFSGSSINWLIKTSAYTLSNLDGILADTSGGVFSLTLPPSPSLGDTVHFYDYKNTWTTNNLTILRNGSNIDGTAEDLVCDTCQHIILTYTDATVGWQISSEMLAYNGNVISEDTTDVSGANWVLDEDDMASDDDEKVPTQQSVKAYSDNTKMSKEDYLLSAGRIMNPLLHLPLKNGFNMPFGTGSVTFTRASSATYIDRYGVVQKVGNDVARFEKEGLLIEGASTNKCLQSEDLSNASWLKSNCSISSNATTAPDGTTTADGVIGNTSDTYHRVYQQISTTATSCSFSFFAKKGNKDWAILICSLTDSSYNNLQSGTTYINLDSGVVGINTIANFKLTALADGWYYCSGTLVYDGGSSVAYAKIELWSADANNDANFAGDGSTVNTYFWGAQVEEIPFATSYIPTTTAAVTRAKDVCYVTATNNTPEFNTENCSILCSGNILGERTYQSLFGHDELYYVFLRINIPSGTKIDPYYGNEFVQIPWSFDTEMHTYGLIYDSSTEKISSYMDGEQVHSPTSRTDPTTRIIANPTSFYIGSRGGGLDPLYGHISNFRIYDVALTEAEMRIA